METIGSPLLWLVFAGVVIVLCDAIPKWIAAVRRPAAAQNGCAEDAGAAQPQPSGGSK